MNTTKRAGKNGSGRVVSPPSLAVVEAQSDPRKPDEQPEPDEPDEPDPEEHTPPPTDAPKEKPPTDAVASALMVENEKLKADIKQLLEDNQKLAIGLNRAQVK